MKVIKIGHVNHLDDNVLKSIINLRAIQRVKRTDPHPQILFFVIGYEGNAGGTAMGYGPAKFVYTATAVETMVKKTRPGTPVYQGHNVDPDYPGMGAKNSDRLIIGETVGVGILNIDNRPSAVVGVYQYSDHSSMPFDIASIEADVVWDVVPDGDEFILQVTEVIEVTGVALASSVDESPGFPGAVLIGSVTALNRLKHGGTQMTKDEIVNAIASLKLAPSDVFSQDAIRGDEVVIQFVRSEKQTEYEHAKRVEGQLKDARTSAAAEIAQLKGDLEKANTSITELNKTVIQGTVDSRFKKIAGDRKLSGKKLQYVESKIVDFKPTESDGDKVDKEIDTFITDKLNEFDETAKLFGVDAESSSEENDKGGTSDSRTPEQVEYESELLDPKKNDFIPE